MKKSISHQRIDFGRWAKEACDGLMFLGTSIIEEKECLRKIQKGIELCEALENLDQIRADKEVPVIDIETYMALKRVADSKSSFDYESFEKIKGKIREAKDALMRIMKNPDRRDEKLDDYQLFFSHLARLLTAISS